MQLIHRAKGTPSPQQLSTLLEKKRAVVPWLNGIRIRPDAQERFVANWNKARSVSDGEAQATAEPGPRCGGVRDG
jgi:hypothetical protein